MDTTHPPTESGVEQDDLNNTTITVVGLVSAAVVLASALGVKALYETYLQFDRDAKNQTYANTAVDTTLQAQWDTIHGDSRAVAGQSGVYTLPIDDAMQLVVKELSDKRQGD